MHVIIAEPSIGKVKEKSQQQLITSWVKKMIAWCNFNVLKAYITSSCTQDLRNLMFFISYCLADPLYPSSKSIIYLKYVVHFSYFPSTARLYVKIAFKPEKYSTERPFQAASANQFVVQSFWELLLLTIVYIHLKKNDSYFIEICQSRWRGIKCLIIRATYYWCWWSPCSKSWLV